MTIRFTSTVIVLAFIIYMCHGEGQDVTLQPGSKGEGVARAVVRRIRSRCVFSENRQFVRRLAWVLSHDGTDALTYRPDFHGGIWQVSQAMLQSTQVCTDRLLKPACDTISKEFNINWPSVQWSDLRKPLYSGLAAALFSLKTLNGRPMPGRPGDQANIFSKMYKLPTQTFVDQVAKMKDIDCSDKMDLLFILDGSGSVRDSDFIIMKDFTADVVNVMNISPDDVRIAEIIFSYDTKIEFDFDQYTDKDTVKAQLKASERRGGQTFTAKALDQATTVLDPSSGHGARPNVKKVAVLVTDGHSDSLADTTAAARRLKAKGNTAFAVGVGRYRLEELQKVASEPSCSHVMTLTGFDQLGFILNDIQQSACGAVIQATNNTTVDGCKTTTIQIIAPDDKSSVLVSVSSGILDVYVSKTDPEPGPAIFDAHYQVLPNQPKVLTFVSTLPPGTLVYVTVVAKLLPPSAVPNVKCPDISWTLKVINKPTVTCTCDRDGVVEPCTETDLIVSGKCGQDAFDAKYPVDNPCTTDNLSNGKMRHIYPYDSTKFIQCDQNGEYYIGECPGGVIFNTVTMECGFTSRL